MITQEETDLQTKISAIQKACREAHEQLEVLLEPLREPLGEYARELKALQMARFELETGLKIGDELYPTLRFRDLQQQEGNGQWWRDNEPLRVDEYSFRSFEQANQIRVGQGGQSVGGVPILMAMEMRWKWLDHQSPIASDPWEHNPKARPHSHPGTKEGDGS